MRRTPTDNWPKLELTVNLFSSCASSTVSRRLARTQTERAAGAGAHSAPGPLSCVVRRKGPKGRSGWELHRTAPGCGPFRLRLSCSRRPRRLCWCPCSRRECNRIQRRHHRRGWHPGNRDRHQRRVVLDRLRRRGVVGCGRPLAAPAFCSFLRCCSARTSWMAGKMDLLAGATGGCCSGVALGSKSGSALLRFDIAKLPSRSGPHPSPGSQRTRTTASGYSIVVGRRLRRLAPNPRHPGGRRGRTRWSVLGLQVELCVGDHLGRRLCRHPLSAPAPRLRRGCPGAKESGASRKTLPETPSSCAGVVVGGCHATCPAQDDGGAPMVAVDEVGRAV